MTFSRCQGKPQAEFGLKDLRGMGIVLWGEKITNPNYLNKHLLL